MSRPRIFVTRRWPESVIAEMQTRYEVTHNDADVPLTASGLCQAMTAYDVLCPTITDRIDAEVLGQDGGTVSLIANFGVGTDHVDLDAARSAGIAVTNTPGVLTQATAELAILLMLMVARRAGEGERELRAGKWPGWHPTHLIGAGLHGKRLGLVGFGRIGRETARMARALWGMEVAYSARHPAGREAQFEPSLAALLEWADVVSLHCPGGPETHHLIDGAMLSRMRPNAILVNTARGTVVDEAALALALREGRIAGAGLDVYEREPAIHPDLLACENAVLLPHLGSATMETRTAMGMRALANIDAFMADAELPDRVA